MRVFFHECVGKKLEISSRNIPTICFICNFQPDIYWLKNIYTNIIINFFILFYSFFSLGPLLVPLSMSNSNKVNYHQF